MKRALKVGPQKLPPKKLIPKAGPKIFGGIRKISGESLILGDPLFIGHVIHVASGIAVELLLAIK